MKGQKWPTFTPPATTLCRRYRGRVLLRRLQAKYGGMDVSEAKRLKALEDENGKGNPPIFNGVQP